MSKKYFKLSRPVKDYAAADLLEILGGCSNAIILRTIILNERDFLSVNYERSLRSFWYSTVKPSLDKLGLLTENDSTEAALTRWDGELSRYVAELVRAGEVTYQGLRIVDNSRQRMTPGISYNTPDLDTYAYKTTAAPYPNIIISTEKDTVYSIIEGIARFFGCSCISGKGQNSLAAMEDLLRNMGEDGRPVYILTLTDYDPAGYYIAQTFKNQVEDLQAAQGIRRRVYIHRIGITPDQLDPDEVIQNWYTPKPAGLEKWMKATNGINGHARGLELDALPPDRIRRIFTDSLRSFIEPEVYADFIKRAFLQKNILEALRPKVEQIIQGMTADLLEGVSLVKHDLFDHAAAGLKDIPVSALCSADLERIRAGVDQYFIN